MFLDASSHPYITKKNLQRSVRVLNFHAPPSAYPTPPDPHHPSTPLQAGDIAVIGQCRPLAKTVKFNMLAHEPSTNTALNVKKAFRMF